MGYKGDCNKFPEAVKYACSLSNSEWECLKQRCAVRAPITLLTAADSVLP